MEIIWTRDSNHPSSLAAKTHLNLRGKQIDMTMLSVAKPMESGISVISAVKGLSVLIPEDLSMVTKLPIVMNRYSFL